MENAFDTFIAQLGKLIDQHRKGVTQDSDSANREAVKVGRTQKHGLMKTASGVYEIIGRSTIPKLNCRDYLLSIEFAATAVDNCDKVLVCKVQKMATRLMKSVVGYANYYEQYKKGKRIKIPFDVAKRMMTQLEKQYDISQGGQAAIDRLLTERGKGNRSPACVEPSKQKTFGFAEPDADIMYRCDVTKKLLNTGDIVHNVGEGGDGEMVRTRRLGTPVDRSSLIGQIPKAPKKLRKKTKSSYNESGCEPRNGITEVRMNRHCYVPRLTQREYSLSNEIISTAFGVPSPYHIERKVYKRCSSWVVYRARTMGLCKLHLDNGVFFYKYPFDIAVQLIYEINNGLTDVDISDRFAEMKRCGYEPSPNNRLGPISSDEVTIRFGITEIRQRTGPFCKLPRITDRDWATANEFLTVVFGGREFIPNKGFLCKINGIADLIVKDAHIVKTPLYKVYFKDCLRLLEVLSNLYSLPKDRCESLAVEFEKARAHFS